MIDASRRLLPPTGALRCLEAAARLGSFSRAGDELGLTQSAVSRQISMLEDWLQARLFDRSGRRVSATPVANQYLAAVGPALGRIKQATAAVLDRRDERELTIATLPSFGMRWLAPRLARFSSLHPDIIVNFTARSVPFDLSAAGYDGAVHYGLPNWENVAHTFLFREVTMPVMSPRLAAERYIREPEDLLSVPLLSQQSRRGAWERWFLAAGVAIEHPLAGPVYEQFMMLAHAAAAGAGAALIPTFLIEPELASGALVAPFATRMTSDEAYYFVRSESAASAPLRAFEAWIAAEAASS